MNAKKVSKLRVSLNSEKRDSPVADTELIPAEHRSQYRRIRVVPKIDLYNFSNEDVDMDRNADVPGTSVAYQPKGNFPPGFSWTSWQQAGSSEGSAQHFRQPMFRRLPRKTNMQNNLEKALRAPLDNMTKAESMMQKMGWKGGALGKEGNGILEPIAPDATYAKCTLGFGQKIADEKPRSLKWKKPVKIATTLAESVRKVGKKKTTELFFTNLLQIILGFVLNDREIEVAFDAKLTRGERLRIHKVVNDAISCNDFLIFNYDNNLMEMVQEINKFNEYILKTESETLAVGRQLSLFKVEPEHVFMVTPLDLNPEKDKIEEVTPEIDSKDITTETNVSEKTDDNQTDISNNNSEHDSSNRINDIASNDTSQDLETVDSSENNDVLIINDNEYNDIKSESKIDVTKDTEMVIDESDILDEIDKESLECECCEKPKELYILIGYFLAFAYDGNYTEFRFLGPFNDIEDNVIDFFISDMTCLIRGNIESICVKYGKVAELGPFEIREHCNGSQVIHKVINID